MADLASRFRHLLSRLGFPSPRIVRARPIAPPLDAAPRSVPPVKEESHPAAERLWVERAILDLNRRMGGDDRPEPWPDFLQPIPAPLLRPDVVSTDDLSAAAHELILGAARRIGRLRVPVSRPRLEYTTQLPPKHAGQFGEDSRGTFIRIRPEYASDHFKLGAVLVHELSHFIRRHNGLAVADENEDERLTDLFVMRSGHGRLCLSGVHDTAISDLHTSGGRVQWTVGTFSLGYLGLETLAWAHARCAAQHDIAPEDVTRGLHGRALACVVDAVAALRTRAGWLEILFCGNGHALRVPKTPKEMVLRCPTCGWRNESFWLSNAVAARILKARAEKHVAARRDREALDTYRQTQAVCPNDRGAFIAAARCLSRLGHHQDAIRELRRFLDRHRDDPEVSAEMKRLIGRN